MSGTARFTVGNDGRITLNTNNTASEPILLSAPVGQTADLIRLVVNAADKFVVTPAGGVPS